MAPQRPQQHEAMTVAALELSLPPSQLTDRDLAWSDRIGWSCHYGAIETAARYAGVAIRARSFDACWAHGCFPPWTSLSGAAMCYGAPEWNQLPVIAWRDDHAQRFSRDGARDVRLAGAPILYADDGPVQRVPGSLLVMPMHSHTEGRLEDRSFFQNYADDIARHAGTYSSVIACIHSNCVSNGLWIPEFSVHSIPVIRGASWADVKALVRMRRIFSSFESMTTNGWGSHVAYALAFGCRVSIHGASPELNRHTLLQDEGWRRSPKDLDEVLQSAAEQRYLGSLADHCRPPDDARADVEKGRFLIGADHQLSRAEMKAMLADVTRLRFQRVVWDTKRLGNRVLRRLLRPR